MQPKEDGNGELDSCVVPGSIDDVVSSGLKVTAETGMTDPPTFRHDVINVKKKIN